MPEFTRTTDNGPVTLHYEITGEGFPVLLIAPGGMRSAIDFWNGTPWDPRLDWGIPDDGGPGFQVIAMDQRNAGSSVGPITAADGWATYTDDQLALLDHLGADRFAVAGMCIGGSYIMALAAAAPDRVAAGIVFQTIGLDNNREAFFDMFDSWAVDLPAAPSPEVLTTFRSNMYGVDDFLFTADDDAVRNCHTPLLVLKGNDLYHPASSSLRLAELAPGATLIDDWKDGPGRDAARRRCLDFLRQHGG